MRNGKDRLSIFISLILRHKPEVIGLSLDTHGWVPVSDLINGINKHGRYHIDAATLDDIVSTDNKQRYAYDDSKTHIRANQGHSVHVDLDLQPCTPPKYLYHGTDCKSVEAICVGGIVPMSRQYVHLSTDVNTATKVALRHGKKPVIFKVDAEKMHKRGYVFYKSVNGVYLCSKVPEVYLTFV